MKHWSLFYSSWVWPFTSNNGKPEAGLYLLSQHNYPQCHVPLNGSQSDDKLHDHLVYVTKCSVLFSKKETTFLRANIHQRASTLKIFYFAFSSRKMLPLPMTCLSPDLRNFPAHLSMLTPMSPFPAFSCGTPTHHFDVPPRRSPNLGCMAYGSGCLPCPLLAHLRAVTDIRLPVCLTRR